MNQPKHHSFDHTYSTIILLFAIQMTLSIGVWVKDTATTFLFYLLKSLKHGIIVGHHSQFRKNQFELGHHFPFKRINLSWGHHFQLKKLYFLTLMIKNHRKILFFCKYITNDKYNLGRQDGVLTEPCKLDYLIANIWEND